MTNLCLDAAVLVAADLGAYSRGKDISLLRRELSKAVARGLTMASRRGLEGGERATSRRACRLSVDCIG
jgi:hypothetical protein